jgi:hypothetical protein
MSLKILIDDGKGGGYHAQVTKDNELVVIQGTSPPLLPQKTQVFTQYLTDDGLSDGSEDLGIDGATTPTTFWIPASEDKDRYITQISFVLGYAASGGLWEFADSNSALTNGVLVNYIDSTGAETEIVTIYKNSDLARVAIKDGIVGTAWALRHLGALNDYGMLATINLGDIIKPFGIQLERGTQQKIQIEITDDCTSATTFNCRALGFERYE